ncbi:MAG: D-sedoheptulose-7-phosphate isomerase [Frankiaceae bacterium]
MAIPVGTTALGGTTSVAGTRARVGTTASEVFGRRVAPTQALARDAGLVAQTCRDMAARFRRGGTLLVFGNAAAATDAQHIAVEFLHPVIVGKRALPAVSLTNDWATLSGLAAARGAEEVFASQVRALGRPHDIALGVSADGRCPDVLHGLRAAAERGLLTVALVGGDGGGIAVDPAVTHALVTPSTDPRVVKEVHVTTYHILWELVHVLLEHQDVLADGVPR